mmetsp:Transcript_81195/g.262493  ORF Transcript_81195/g.262493 Transcript_81195/m.262493 type:complete len:559 (-) Transcript_81195:105-1781(-)
MLGRTTNFRSRSMPLIALAVGFLIAILPIAFDKSVAFLQYARRPSTMAGQKRKPRIQLRAMPGVLYGMEVESLLEQLQATPTESVILALERLWRPADASVSSLSGLVGEWDLLNADPQKRMSNNLFKAILNMYRSSLAKAMKVDFASAPRLTVAADGKMEMSSDLIMGPRRDSISFFGTVSLQGPNRFKDQPRAVRSQNLRVTLPLFQRARDLRVTYYDGEVLVLRDSLGDADVFRRRRGDARPRTVPAAAVASAPQVPPSPSRGFKEHVVDLRSKVELLKEALQGHHANAAATGAEAAQGRAEVAVLEAELRAAEVEAKAHAVKRDVMEGLKSKLTVTAESQRMTSSEKEKLRSDLRAELSIMNAQIAQLEGQQQMYVAREESLRNQIKALEGERRVAPRDAWPSYKAVIEQSKAELNEVKAQLKDTKTAAIALRRDIAQKSFKLPGLEKVADAGSLVREQMERQLVERMEEIAVHEVRMAGTEAALAQLRGKLEVARAVLFSAEASEGVHRKQAAAIHAELGEIIAQAREIQDMGKQTWPADVAVAKKPRNWSLWR